VRTTRGSRVAATLLTLALTATSGAACGADDGDGGAGATSTTIAPVDGGGSPDVSPGDPVTDAVELGVAGIGPATIGDPAQEAIDALTAVFGEPSATSAWSQPGCELAGPDSDGAFIVTWGDLFVAMRGPTEAEATFAGYTYRGADGEPTSGLATSEGIAIGSTGADIADAYGDAATFDPESTFGPLWLVDTDGGGQYVFSVDGASDGAVVAEIALDPVFCE